MVKREIRIFWSEEDGCFVAVVPSLPGLSAFGDTEEEAIAEAEVAIEGFEEVMREDGVSEER